MLPTFDLLGWVSIEAGQAAKNLVIVFLQDTIGIGMGAR